MTASTVIIQFGEQRTGTEFQHALLCAWAMITFVGAPSRVSCPFWKAAGPAPIMQSGKVYVIKTHRNLWNVSWAQLYPNHHLRLFATTGSTSASEERDWRNVAVRLSPIVNRNATDLLNYVQPLSLLQHQSFEYVVDVYRQILHFTESQSAELLDFMRRWNVMNRCCSRTLSRSEVTFIRHPKSYSPHENAGSRNTTSCVAYYRLDEEEEAFLSTRIVRVYGTKADVHTSYVLRQRTENETAVCRTLRASVAADNEWKPIMATKW